MFMAIGFDLVFQVLNVIFKLIFIIVFMPLFIAAYAFEGVWEIAKNAAGTAIKILLDSVVSIIKISLKTCLVYAVVYFSADSFYPGPMDGFTTIMPPLLGQIAPKNMDAQTMSVMAVFSECEKVALVGNEMDKDKFLACFNTQRNVVTQKYPGAFDFMDDGFEFLIFMMGVALLYFWIISPQINKLIGSPAKEDFDYGTWVKNFGKMVYHAPAKIFDAVKGNMKK